MEFGGAEGPSAVSIRAEVVVGEVASSSSSMTLALIVATEEGILRVFE